jgi:hypothetical protein
MSTILDLNSTEARSYFLEQSNYVNFDLPPYISFADILEKLSTKLSGSQISNYFKVVEDPHTGKNKPLDPKDMSGVGHVVISNKDGEFAWRPFEIIHPALYVALVHDITTSDNWTTLVNRFSYFSKSIVKCESIPLQSTSDLESHKALQVKKWWSNVEQESIKLGLQFQYVFDADISDCYGSIYTHSISWAIHEKSFMKEHANRVDSDLIGNRIDWLIQKMRHGQTNGIPQGSTLVDFIAEIILGYIDTLLTTRLEHIDTNEFAIIRFRDDYKVFTNRPELGKEIVRILSEILSSLGMRLNVQKTKMKDDPILASLKEDKVYELFVPSNRMNLSKWLTQIYAISNKYPNSGVVTRQLDKYFKALDKSKKLAVYENPEVMISTATNLAVKNPRTYPLCMAIISKLVDFCEPSSKLELISKMKCKFDTIPNTGLLDIWLQRVSYKINPSIVFNEPIAKIVSEYYFTNYFWESGWLKDDMKDLIKNTSIVDRNILAEMNPVITREEVALFRPPTFS